MKRKVLLFLSAMLIASTTLFAQGASDYIDAAQKGNAAAQCLLGYYYANGWGVEQDYNQAVRWWTLSANQGYAAAQYNLGVCYENGWVVEKNYYEAARLWKLAAEQGNGDAQWKLGGCYIRGQGVENDLEKL